MGLEARRSGGEVGVQLVDVFGEDRWSQLSAIDRDSVVETSDA